MERSHGARWLCLSLIGFVAMAAVPTAASEADLARLCTAERLEKSERSVTAIGTADCRVADVIVQGPEVRVTREGEFLKIRCRHGARVTRGSDVMSADVATLVFRLAPQPRLWSISFVFPE